MTLKLSGADDSKAMSARSSVSNLTTVESSETRTLEFPSSFRELHNLHEVSFKNLHISLADIRGLEKFPACVTSLRVDNDSPHRLDLDSIAVRVRNHIKHLSFEVPIIGSRLGLYKFPILESVELYPKKEFDEGVFRELHHCPRLSHVRIGGILNLDSALREHFHALNLHSSDISNAMITPKTLAEIHTLSNLKNLAFHGCVFDSFDLSSLLPPSGIESLSFDRCYPIENNVLGILSLPSVRNLRSISFSLSNALSQDQWAEVCARRRELGGAVSIHWDLSEVG